jgi:hypothetical protein
MRGHLGATALAVGLAAAACGGGGGGSPAAPSPTPQNPFRVTINEAGAVTPVELVVPPGTRVLFINNHSRRHDMGSDEHPDHLECPAINSVGLLTPGQSRETGNLNVVRTCGYHDHEDPDNQALRGRIVVR